VTLAYDANGYLVTTATTQQCRWFDHHRQTRRSTPTAALASETTSTTSVDGKTVTISRDTNSDGVIDSIQTDVTVDNADGSNSLTVTNFDGTGSHVLNRTVTTPAPTSRPSRSIAIRPAVDFFDQIDGRRQGWRGEFDRHSPRLQSGRNR